MKKYLKKISFNNKKLKKFLIKNLYIKQILFNIFINNIKLSHKIIYKKYNN